MSHATESQSPIRLVLSKRSASKDHPNHHLTNNNGTWWCQVTVHHGPFSKRLRFSLETPDLERARQLRDRVFARLSAPLAAA